MNLSMTLGKSALARNLLTVMVAVLVVLSAAITSAVTVIVVSSAIRWAVGAVSSTSNVPASASELVVVSPTKWAYAASTDNASGQPTQIPPAVDATDNGRTPVANPSIGTTTTAVTATPTPTRTKAVATASRTPLPRLTATVKPAEPFYKLSAEVSFGPASCDRFVFVNGTIKDRNGRPVPGIGVRVSWKRFYADPTYGSYGEGSAAAKTDANGNWKVETPFVNVTYFLTNISTVVVSEDGTRTLSPVVDSTPRGSCKDTASAQVNFEKQ